MNGLVQRLAAALVLGRKARVDVFRMIADLLEAGFSLERALGIAAQVAKDQGQRARAQLLLSWRRALLEDRFAETASDALPASEAMIFHAYGRVDAAVLFAAAARVAEMRDRQLAAVWKALAMPLVLAVGLVLLLWAAGGYFVPVIETVSPPEEWSTGARLFRSMSTWLHANTLLFGGMLAALAALTAWAMVAWTGPGRTQLDRVAPFSLYRMLTGSAFLFVVMEFLAAGIDVNDRAFEALKRSASPYVRHRIASIQGFMAGGAGLGRSMVLDGSRLPRPLSGAGGGGPRRGAGVGEEARALRGALGGAFGGAAARPRGGAERGPVDRGGRGHGIGHRRDVLDPRAGRRTVTGGEIMDAIIDDGAGGGTKGIGERRNVGAGRRGRAAGRWRQLRQRRYRRGFSLFGVLLGLTLAAVAIVGAVSLYNAARESANRSQALTLLNQLRANVESVYAGAPSYGNDTNLVATIDRRGGIPDSARMVVGSAVQIRHPFGGLVTVTGGPGGAANQFRIAFNDVDDEVCAAMGDAYAGRSRARAGIVSLTINGTALTSPVTVAQVTANCDDGAGANDIGFTFG